LVPCLVLNSISTKMNCFKGEYRYSRISEGKQSVFRVFFWGVVGFVVVVSFFAGRVSVGLQDERNMAVLQGPTTVKSFEPQQIFTGPSSNRTDEAWNELFPKHGGFFNLPDSTQRATFSVYHQLHCLNGIRQGYWMIHQAAMTGQALVDEDLPMMATPAHIRHCIDLLRQSVMCYRDTAMELKDNEMGGVNGWGTEHQCHDYEELVRWTNNVQSL